MTRPPSHCRPRLRATSASIPTAAGCTRSRKKARRSSCSTTISALGACRARRSRRCRPGSPAATSAPRSRLRRRAIRLWGQPAARQHRGLFRGPQRRLAYLGEGVDAEDYPRSFNFDRPAGSHSCNQQRRQRGRLRVNRQTGGLEFSGDYAAVGNPSSIVFVDLAGAG